MFQQKRRAERKAAALQVKLLLFNSEDDALLAGPVVAFLADISYYGAGLFLQKVFLPPHHLFYAPRENEKHVLCLKKERNDSQEDIIVPIQPVWMRLADGDEAGFFRMGVEFMTDPEDPDVIDLERIAQASCTSEEDLLSKLLKMFH